MGRLSRLDDTREGRAMNFSYYEGVMDCAEGLPPSVGRDEDYYRGYGDEYAYNIDKPEEEL